MTKFEVFKENVQKLFSQARYTVMPLGLAAVISLSGCQAAKQQEETSPFDNIFMTTYNQESHQLIWDGISDQEYQDKPLETIVAVQEEQEGDKKVLYIVDTFGQGYLAGQSASSKQEAMDNNPDYKDDENFLKGFDIGKQDKYLDIASAEGRQYIAITTSTDKHSEEMFYPLDTLSVVSYDGLNAVVENYNEEAVNNGDYTDLLGQDITPYIGQEYQVSSFHDFAIKHTDQIEDSIYVRPNNYKLIPQISTSEFTDINVFAQTKTK